MCKHFDNRGKQKYNVSKTYPYFSENSLLRTTARLYDLVAFKYTTSVKHVRKTLYYYKVIIIKKATTKNGILIQLLMWKARKPSGFNAKYSLLAV